MPLSRRHSITTLYPAVIARRTDNALFAAWQDNRLSVGCADMAALLPERVVRPASLLERALIRGAVQATLHRMRLSARSAK